MSIWPISYGLSRFFTKRVDFPATALLRANVPIPMEPFSFKIFRNGCAKIDRCENVNVTFQPIPLPNSHERKLLALLPC